jgi:hypothetical protein
MGACGPAGRLAACRGVVISKDVAGSGTRDDPPAYRAGRRHPTTLPIAVQPDALA